MEVSYSLCPLRKKQPSPGIGVGCSMQSIKCAKTTLERIAPASSERWGSPTILLIFKVSLFFFVFRLMLT